jgi:hypothetical protein
MRTLMTVVLFAHTVGCMEGVTAMFATGVMSKLHPELPNPVDRPWYHLYGATQKDWENNLIVATNK